MSIRIVTDSTCDLPQHIIEENHITVMPLTINIGTKEYRDGVDISRQDYYQRLPNIRPAPTTAAPGPDVFRAVYEKLAKEGATEILSIHVSSTLSAVYSIAEQAAKATRAAVVTAFDSRQLSMGMGFQALAAARAAAAGKTLNEILSILQDQIRRTHTIATLETLEYLRRSGRMHIALSTIGTILQIKPILKMYEGVATTERVRTRSGARKRLMELLTDYGPFETAAMLYSGARDTAQAFLEEVRHLLPEGEIWLEEINPVLGTHLGPGVVGFVCISTS